MTVDERIIDIVKDRRCILGKTFAISQPLSDLRIVVTAGIETDDSLEKRWLRTGHSSSVNSRVEEDEYGCRQAGNPEQGHGILEKF